MTKRADKPSPERVLLALLGKPFRICALLLTVKDQRDAVDGQRILELTLHPVTCDENGKHVMNITGFMGDDARTGQHQVRDEWLAGLRVRGVDWSQRYSTLVTGDTEYSDEYVTLGKAKRMVQVLSRVERHLARDADRIGRVELFGMYVARVAHAIGATHILFEDGGAGVDSNGYCRVEPLDQAARTIDGIAAEWRARWKPTDVSTE